MLPDGRVAYRVKYAGRGGTHRIMVPVEFLARLAALVAPPRYPLVRYHGVLAPHSKWRSAVVPRPPPAAHAHENPVPPPCSAGAKGHRPASTETPPKPRGPNPPRLPAQRGGGSQANAAPRMSACSPQTSAASPKPLSSSSACPPPPGVAAQTPRSRDAAEEPIEPTRSADAGTISDTAATQHLLEYRSG